MDLMEIATALVDGCRAGQETENLDRLYDTNAVSVEAADFGNGREAHGLDAIKAKHAYWNGMFEVLEGATSDPYPNGADQFAVRFQAKTKHRESGEVSEMDEIAVYHVANGKIVREEFFYPTG